MSVPINYTIGKDKYYTNIPTGWEDVSLSQFVRFNKWTKTEDKDLSVLYSIMLNIPKGQMDKIFNAGILDIINRNTEWIIKGVNLSKYKTPKSIKIGDKTCLIPSNLNELSLGRFIALEQFMATKPSEIDRVVFVLATVLWEQFTDKPYEMKNIKQYETLIKNTKFTIAYPAEVFFWRNFYELKICKNNGWLTARIKVIMLRMILLLNRSGTLRQLTP